MYQEQKEKVSQDYHLNRQESCNRGKVIVYIIALANITTTILSNCLGEFNISNIIIQIGLSVALLSGVNWVRWLFVIGATTTPLFALYVFVSIINVVNQIPMKSILLLILVVIESVVGGSLLAFNKNVANFFYDKQT